MDTSISYIMSQILVTVYYLIYIFTFQLNDNKKILILGIFAMTAGGLSYMLLGAYTGMAMSLIAIIRNLIFSFQKTNKKISSLIFINILIIFFGILTYNNVFSLLDVLATIIYTYSLWNNDTKNYKLLGIIVNLLLVGYDISIKSIFGAIFMGVSVISSLIGYLREKNSKLKKQ